MTRLTMIVLLLLSGCSVARSGLAINGYDYDAAAVQPDAAAVQPDAAPMPDYDGGTAVEPDAGTTPDAGSTGHDAGTPVDAGTVTGTDAGPTMPDSGPADAGAPPPSCMPDESPILGACWSRLLMDPDTGTGGSSRCILRGGHVAEWSSVSEQGMIRSAVVPVVGGGVVGLKHLDLYGADDGHWHWVTTSFVADPQIAWGGAAAPSDVPILDSTGLHTSSHPPDGVLCRRAP